MLLYLVLSTCDTITPLVGRFGCDLHVALSFVSNLTHPMGRSGGEEAFLASENF